MGKSSKTVVEAQEIPEFVKQNLESTYRFAKQINPAVYAGERVAGFTPIEQQAQLMTAERAIAGDPTTQQAQALLGNVITGAATPTYAEGLLGAAAKGTMAPTTAETYLSNIAAGQGAASPFVQTQLQNAISGAVNRATSQYALGGRLGSAAFGSALGSGVAGAAAPILAQQAEADRARQLQAASQLGGLQQQGLSRQVQAGTQLAGLQQQNVARQLQAAGMAPQLAQERFRDIAALSGVGQQQREMQQANLQATQDYINQLNAAKQAQFQARATAAGLGPTNPQGQTTTSTPSDMQTISDLGTAAALAYMAFSDERMKENVEQIQDPITKVNMLDGVTFNYKNQPGRAAGLMAQDVERVLPMAVKETDNGMKAVNYAQVTGLLTEAVKELSNKVARLEGGRS